MIEKKTAEEAGAVDDGGLLELLRHLPEVAGVDEDRRHIGGAAQGQDHARQRVETPNCSETWTIGMIVYPVGTNSVATRIPMKILEPRKRYRPST